MESRDSIRSAVTPWAETHGFSALDPTNEGDEIQLDILRRDPWGAGDETTRNLWLRALFGLNPALLYALLSGRGTTRFHSLAGGQMDGGPAVLCHFSAFAAPPYWLEWVPFGWIVSFALGRVNLSFWQITLSEEEAAGYAGMLSVRDKDDGGRLHEVMQGRRLETTDRVFGHRAVESESVAFLERYSLTVADEADEAAVRDMFGPSFLVFLTQEAPEGLFIELRGNLLNVGVRELALSDEALDALEDAGRRTLAAARDGAGENA